MRPIKNALAGAAVWSTFVAAQTTPAQPTSSQPAPPPIDPSNDAQLNLADATALINAEIFVSNQGQSWVRMFAPPDGSASFSIPAVYPGSASPGSSITTIVTAQVSIPGSTFANTAGTTSAPESTSTGGPGDGIPNTGPTEDCQLQISIGDNLVYNTSVNPSQGNLLTLNYDVFTLQDGEEGELAVVTQLCGDTPSEFLITGIDFETEGTFSITSYGPAGYGPEYPAQQPDPNDTNTPTGTLDPTSTFSPSAILDSTATTLDSTVALDSTATPVPPTTTAPADSDGGHQIGGGDQSSGGHPTDLGHTDGSHQTGEGDHTESLYHPQTGDNHNAGPTSNHPSSAESTDAAESTPTEGTPAVPDSTFASVTRSATSTSTPTDGPFPLTLSGFEFLGCFASADGYPSFKLVESSSSMSIDQCLSTCKGTKYAGVFESDCYCGTTIGGGTRRVGLHQCNQPCPGKKSQMCGGRLRLNARQDVPSDILLTMYVDNDAPSQPLATTTDIASATTTSTAAAGEASDVICVAGVCHSVIIVLKPFPGDFCAGQVVFVKEGGCWAPVQCNSGRCAGQIVYKPEKCYGDQCKEYPAVEPEACDCVGGVRYKPKKTVKPSYRPESDFALKLGATPDLAYPSGDHPTHSDAEGDKDWPNGNTGGPLLHGVTGASTVPQGHAKPGAHADGAAPGTNTNAAGNGANAANAPSTPNEASEASEANEASAAHKGSQGSQGSKGNTNTASEQVVVSGAASAVIATTTVIFSLAMALSFF